MNAPRVNFRMLENQISMYDSSEPSVEYMLAKANDNKSREARFNLELELTALDFIRDELKELAKDVESRSKQLAEQLDSEV